MRAGSVDDVAMIARARRRDLGLSQGALAEAIGASRKWVSEFENGKASAELGLVVRALAALGMTIDIVGDRTGETGEAIDLDAVIDAHRRDA